MEGTIEFSSIHLSIGMPKGKVLTVLAEHYDVSPWKGQGRDLWGIALKTEPHLLVGTVQFEADKLSFASKEWENSNTAYSAIHVTANLLTRLRDEGFARCSVSSRKESESEHELDRDVITIDCGQKTIWVSAERENRNGSDAETVNIYERLEAPSAKKQ
jgi:hypothetical protein